MTKHLILDAGLHGDGDVLYYVDQLLRIRDWYTGWPKLIYKTQYWAGPSPYRTACVEKHGRDPLRPVPLRCHHLLWDICREMGIEYAVTLHDTSVKPGLPVADWVKLSGFNSTDVEMRGHVLEHCSTKYDPPGLIVTGHRPGDLAWTEAWPTPVIKLWGHPRYPHNEPADLDGTSCHWNANRFTEWPERLRECPNVEVHITTRGAKERPLPGDMPVALRMDQLEWFVNRMGECWV